MDDAMMRLMDPRHTSFDVEEGEAEWKKQEGTLMSKLTKGHYRHPDYGQHADGRRDDCMWTDADRATDQLIMQVWEVLSTHKEIFSRTPKTPDQTSTTEHAIILEGEVPNSPPMYRRSREDERLVEEWVAWMLQNGLIRSSTSKFAQNLLVVKKTGKEPRYCLDPRPVNSITKPDLYPTPRIDTIFSRLLHSKVFSTLDAASGFWQVPIRPGDKWKTAFRVGSGVYEFNVMPFGLRNAPATFTRWMAETFHGMQDYLQVYIDDLLIHSSDPSQHAIQLRQVLDRCRANGVQLRLSKCDFLVTSVDLLGFTVTPQGVTKNMKKVDAILKFAKPQNLHDLRSFLGMVNFYKHCHRMLAELVQPLQTLTRKGNKVKSGWGKLHQDSFDKIKEVLAQQCVMFYPDPAKPFVVHTDASDYALGATLLQAWTDEDGETHLRVVEYYSRSLIDREKAYSTTEKEFLAIVTAVERWKHYLYNHFRVVTDHKPLLGIQLTEKPRLKRWALRLAPFSMDIAWKPGKDCHDVDPLSRDPRFRVTQTLRIEAEVWSEDQHSVVLSTPEEEIAFNKEYLQKVQEEANTPEPEWQLPEPEDTPQVEGSTTSATQSLPTSIEEGKGLSEEEEERIWNALVSSIATQAAANMHPGAASLLEEQRGDPVLKEHIKRLESKGTSHDEKYELQKETGVLRKREKGVWRICAPEATEDLILYMYHDHKLSGHMSEKRMMRAIRKLYTFPDMERKVKAWCRHCQCTKAKATLHPNRGMTQGRPFYGLFQYVVLDIVGPFPLSRRKHEYWLTIMDAYSKDLELVPLKTKEAAEVAKALLIFWICRRGVPVALLSDNAKEFVGHVASHLCNMLQIRQDLVTVYHHESAGLVERVHRFAHQIMQSSIEGKVTTWDDQLPFIRFAIFTAEISKTEKSAFEVAYGIRPTMPGDLLVNAGTLPTSLREQYEVAQSAIQSTRDYFLYQRRKARIAEHLKRDEAEGRTKKIFEPGTAVYVSKPSFTRLPGVRGLRKLLTNFRGPYTVIRTDLHNGVYVDVDGVEERYNVDRVSEVATLHPIDRAPPVYEDKRLAYEEKAQQPKERHRDNADIPSAPKRRTDAAQKARCHTSAKTQVPSSKLTKEGQHTSEERGRHCRTTAEVDETPKTTYVVIEDMESNRLWPGEKVSQGELHQVQLLAKAKKGKFDRIWYDPSAEEDDDGPGMIISNRQKSHLLPWTVIPDTTWVIRQERSSYQKLDCSRCK